MPIRESDILTLSPGVAVVPLDGEAMLLRAPWLSVKVEGAAADVLRSRVFPLLDGGRTVADVCRMLADVSAATLQERLGQLFDAGVLRRGTRLSGQGTWAFTAGLELLGAAPGRTAAAVRSARVALFGLDRVGELLARGLVEAGVGRVTLIDPRGDDGVPRAPALAAQLGSAAHANGESPLTRELVASLADGADLLIGAFGRSFEAAQHWINRAAVAREIPAIFASLAGLTAFAGPLVLPGQTPCYMCYRMRATACEPDGVEALAVERQLNAARSPADAPHPELPGLAMSVAATLLSTIVRHLVLREPTPLTAAVFEHDPVQLRITRHAVLRHPECPVCADRKKKVGRISRSVNSSPTGCGAPATC